VQESRHHGRRLGRLLVLAVAAATLFVVVLSARPTAADTFAVTGDFILWDDFPTVTAGERCDAKRSLYHDINAHTPVRAETVDGRRLASTRLGDGVVISGEELATLMSATEQGLSVAEVERLLADVGLQPCVFMFRFELEAGSDHGEGYVVRLGRRGEWHMSEDQLRKPKALQLSIGLR
jgi:hypothetical protein